MAKFNLSKLGYSDLSLLRNDVNIQIKTMEKAESEKVAKIAAYENDLLAWAKAVKTALKSTLEDGEIVAVFDTLPNRPVKPVFNTEKKTRTAKADGRESQKSLIFKAYEAGRTIPEIQAIVTGVYPEMEARVILGNVKGYIARYKKEHKA
jgi:hypothetical protein